MASATTKPGGSGSNGGGSVDPWAWLGLLKWTLSYTDGTKPTDETCLPMSPEDREFLEKVMKEGIIDENERMKTILYEVTKQMDAWKNNSNISQEEEEEDIDTVNELLQELRDIVEQIDYARAFAAMKGLNFLLGCIQQQDKVPLLTRIMCLNIIATMCQHNPPVQKELLELGSIRILSDLFFNSTTTTTTEDTTNDNDVLLLRSKIIQAISANVRSHDLAEAVFCQLEQSTDLLSMGIKVGDDSNNNNNNNEKSSNNVNALRKRTIFFLRALLTSDTSTYERIQRFSPAIVHAIDNVLILNEEQNKDLELVGMTLSLIEQILEQKRSVNAILTRKDVLVTYGIQRITELRKLTGEEMEMVQEELRLWENILTLLARAVPDEEGPVTTTTTAVSKDVISQ